MDFEVYRTHSDVIYRLGTETDHRKVKFLRNAVHQITEKMIAVYGAYADAYRIQACALIFEIHRHDGISMLRSQTYGCLAVSLMDLDGAVCILEADDLVSRKRMAMRTADIRRT